METNNLEKDYKSPNCEVFEIKLPSSILDGSPDGTGTIGDLNED